MSLKRKRTVEDIFQSRLIKFVIDTPGVEFIVHEAAMTRLSEPLRALLTGGMQESVQGKVVWDDVKSSVFLALVEFAYKNDYVTPSLAHSTQIENDGKAANQEEYSPKATSIFGWMTMHGDTWNRPAMYDFCKKHFNEGKVAIWCEQRIQPTWASEMMDPNRTGRDEVFMFHAKIYTLAEKYAIEELRQMCLRRIRVSLLFVSGDESILKAVRELVRYVYEYTSCTDELRYLVLRYCITQIGWLKRCGFITDMIEELPTFGSDLLLGLPQTGLDQMMQRLVT